MYGDISNVRVDGCNVSQFSFTNPNFIQFWKPKSTLRILQAHQSLPPPPLPSRPALDPGISVVCPVSPSLLVPASEPHSVARKGEQGEDNPGVSLPGWRAGTPDSSVCECVYVRISQYLLYLMIHLRCAVNHYLLIHVNTHIYSFASCSYTYRYGQPSDHCSRLESWLNTCTM